jgi:hypothetical protein
LISETDRGGTVCGALEIGDLFGSEFGLGFSLKSGEKEKIPWLFWKVDEERNAIKAKGDGIRKCTATNKVRHNRNPAPAVRAINNASLPGGHRSIPIV